MRFYFGMLIGKSSKLYQKLYEAGLLKQELELDYEFSKEYAHVMISGQSKNPKEVEQALKQEIQRIKEQGIKKEECERNKKKIYGEYIKEYNDVAEIARMFLADYFKGINSFEYLEEYETVSKEYAQQVLNEVFKEEKEIISIVEK